MGEKLTIQEGVKLFFMFYMYFHTSVHGARHLGHSVYIIQDIRQRAAVFLLLLSRVIIVFINGLVGPTSFFFTPAIVNLRNCIKYCL